MPPDCVGSGRNCTQYPGDHFPARFQIAPNFPDSFDHDDEDDENNDDYHNHKCTLYPGNHLHACFQITPNFSDQLGNDDDNDDNDSNDDDDDDNLHHYHRSHKNGNHHIVYDIPLPVVGSLWSSIKRVISYLEGSKISISKRRKVPGYVFGGG